MKKALRTLLLTLLLLTALPLTALAAKSYPYYGVKLIPSYSKLIRNLNAGETQVTLPTTGTHSFIQDDYPRLFWINTILGVRQQSGSVTGYVVEEWSGAYKQKAAFEKSVKKAVKAVKAKCKGKSKAQQAKIAMDYIVSHCSYSSSKYDQTAYGVFVKKKAVCAGYARAYKILCDELGIPCLCVPCNMIGYTGGLHMVNYVKLGKKWYCVDVTSADVGKTSLLATFLLGRNNSRVWVRTTQAHGVKLPTVAKNDYPFNRSSNYRLVGDYTLINCYL